MTSREDSFGDNLSRTFRTDSQEGEAMPEALRLRSEKVQCLVIGAARDLS